jgi:hypothetical protein
MNKENIDTQLSTVGNLILSEERNDMFIVVLEGVRENKLASLGLIIDEIHLTYPMLETHTEVEQKNKFDKGRKVYTIKMQFEK